MIELPKHRAGKVLLNGLLKHLIDTNQGFFGRNVKQQDSKTTGSIP